MKIHPEQIKALKQEESQSSASKKAQSNFSELFAAQLQGADKPEPRGTEVAKVPAPQLLVADVLAVQNASAQENFQQGQKIMDKLENLLEKWENYAARLETPQGSHDLRKVAGVLDNIESGVNSMKNEFSAMDKEHPQLQGVVDELEILAVTERIKLNRGDYL